MYAMSAPHDQFAHYNGGYPVDGNEAADYSYQRNGTGYYYHTSQDHQQPPPVHGSGYAGYDEPTSAMMMSSMGSYQQQCYGRAMGDGGYNHQHDADHYPAARAAYGAGPAPGPAPCVVCGVQQVPFHGAACTRRCRWFADGCCPQCGRGRASAATAFCSLGCAGEARQANWCVGCGVRQVLHGGTSCSAPHCAAVVARLAARFAHNHTTAASAAGQATAFAGGGRAGPRSAFGGAATGRRGSLNSNHGSAASNNNNNHASSSSMPPAAAGGKRRFEPHAVLAPNDKVATSVRQQLGSDLARRVAAVVKVGGASDARKAYTAYRNRVEGELNESCGIGAPKYGHGGEGNEHRRYLVLASECGAAVAGGGGEPTFCGSASCGVCCFLEHGAAALLSRTHDEGESATAAPGYRAYSTASSAAAAVASATSGPSAALVVARVTIGAPSFAAPPQNVTSPSSSERTHCVVERRDTYDIATLPADVACVDPLFVVVLRGQQQQ